MSAPVLDAWLPPGLRRAVALRLRSAAREGWQRARTPSGAVTTLLSLAFLGVWLIPVFLWPLPFRPVDASWLARVGPVGILLVWVGQVVVRGGGEVLGFVPAEADQLFAGPFTPAELLRYKVTLLLFAWVSGAVLLSPMAMFYAAHPLGGFLALVLLLPFLQLSSMISAMVRQGRGRSRALRAAFLVALVVAAAVATSVRPERNAAAWSWLVAFESHPVAVALLLPFSSGAALMTEAALPRLLGAAAVVLACDGLLVAVLLHLGRGAWLEIAADGAQHLQETLSAYRSGGGSAALGGWWSWRLPRPPRWGGVGPLAWRRATEIVRRPATAAAVGGVLLLVGVTVIAVPLAMPGVGRPALARTVLSTGLAWSTVLVPGLLRQDFRADLDRMDTLLSMPIRPIAVVLGQILPMALLVGALGETIVLASVVVSPEVATVAVPVAFAAPAFAVAVLAVENALFLWFPVRTEAGEAALQSVGRNLVVSLVAWGVHGTGLVVAVAVAAVVSVFVGSGVIVGLVAATPLLLLAALAVVAATVRFGRFDPSVHVPR